MAGNSSYKKSPHDTALKSKRQQGQLVGALKDTSTQLSRSVLNTAKDAQEVFSDASIAQENVKNKFQPERRGSKERTLSGAPPWGSCRAATEGFQIGGAGKNG